MTSSADRDGLADLVYRTSWWRHRDLSPTRRRQILATDATRFDAPGLQRELAESLPWRPRWVSGQTKHGLPAGANRPAGHGESSRRYCRDGEPIAVVAESFGATRVWDLAAGTLRATLTEDEDDRVLSVACTLIHGRPVAVTAGQGETLGVWDLATGTRRATLGDRNGYGLIHKVSCTHINGRPMAVTGGPNKTVQIWDLASGRLRSTLSGHADSVFSVACGEIDGQPVAVTGGLDRTLRVWDLVSSTGRAVVSASGGLIMACATVDGRAVAVTGGSDATARVWTWPPERCGRSCPDTQPSLIRLPAQQSTVGRWRLRPAATARPASGIWPPARRSPLSQATVNP